MFVLRWMRDVLCGVGSFFVERRKRELAHLHLNYARLKNLVSELLARANEADEQAAYMAVNDSRRARKLRSICDELVLLSDTLPEIESLLAEERIKPSREAITRSVHAIEAIAKQIEEIQLIEPRLIDERPLIDRSD